MMPEAMMLFPLLVLLLWVAVIVYMLVLATRLVRAVEQIARSVGSRPFDPPRS